MKTARTLGLVCAAVVLAACAGLPDPQTGTGTLLAIPLEKRAGATLSGDDFWIGLKDSKYEHVLSPTADGLCILTDLPVGTYVIDRMGRMVWRAFAGAIFGSRSEPWAIDPIEFSLVEGTITILPVTLKLTATFPGHFFVPTDRDTVLERLAALKNFAAWKVAP